MYSIHYRRQEYIDRIIKENLTVAGSRLFIIGHGGSGKRWVSQVKQLGMIKSIIGCFTLYMTPD